MTQLACWRRVDSSDDAIVSKTLDGVITSCNKAAELLFGYTANEAIGQHITLIIPDNRINEETIILQKLCRGERIEHFDTVRMCKDGTTRDVSLTISPLKAAAGTIVGASTIARDITREKEAEGELLDSNKHYRDGIRGMRERLHQFGGELTIDSDGSGTTISAVLPSKYRA